MQEFEILAEIIEDLTGVKRDELVSKCKKRNLAELRTICSNIILASDKKYTREEIGEAMNKDHSTIIYHTKIHPNLMIQKNGSYKELYNQILKVYNSKVVLIGDDVRPKLLKEKRRLENKLKDIKLALKQLEVSEN